MTDLKKNALNEITYIPAVRYKDVWGKNGAGARIGAKVVHEEWDSAGGRSWGYHRAGYRAGEGHGDVTICKIGA